MQNGLGTVTVATPGVLVRITNNQMVPSEWIGAQSILLQALSNAAHTNTGRIYIYTQTTFGLKRVATLAPPAVNSIPSFSATIPNAAAALNASIYWIDADEAGDGVDASFLVP